MKVVNTKRELFPTKGFFRELVMLSGPELRAISGQISDESKNILSTYFFGHHLQPFRSNWFHVK